MQSTDSSSSSSSTTTATTDHYCIHILDESNNLLTIERSVPSQLAAYTRIHSALADSCWALSNVAITGWRLVLYHHYLTISSVLYTHCAASKFVHVRAVLHCASLPIDVCTCSS
jgi:hypothetical protein